MENGKEETKCRCGKPLKPQHCHSCGSTNIYARRKNDALFYDEDKKEIKTAYGFHCRKCHVDFNTLMPCEAPFFESSTMVQKRIKDQAQAQMTQTYVDALKRGGKAELRRVQLEMVQKLIGGGLGAVLAGADAVLPNPNRDPETGEYKDNWPPPADGEKKGEKPQ